MSSRSMFICQFLLAVFGCQSVSGQFLRHGELQNFRLFLPVSAVEYRGGHVVRLDSANGLRGVRLNAIALECQTWTDRDLEKLTEMPSLQYLQLHSDNLTDDGLAVLTKLRTLKGLQLSGRRITDAGIIKLKELHELEELSLSVGWRESATPAVSENAIKALAGLAKLRRLSLAGSVLSGSVFNALSKFTQLWSLQLGANPTAEGQIGKLQELRGLKELFIDSQTLNLADWQTLASLPSLVTLVLENCNDARRLTVSQLPRFMSLENLGLTFSAGIDDEILRSLSKMPSLVRLDLSGARSFPGVDIVSESCFGAFCKSHALKTLMLRGTSRFSTECLNHISTVKSLEYLDLRGCANLTNDVVKSLGQLIHLRGLVLVPDARASGEPIPSDESLGSLASLTSLVFLDVSGCTGIKGQGLHWLPKATQLAELVLNDCTALDAIFLSTLSKCKRLFRVSVANVAWIDDGSVATLCRSETLFELTLWGCTKVTNQSLEEFAKNKTLKAIGIYGTSVTSDALEKFLSVNSDRFAF